MISKIIVIVDHTNLYNLLEIIDYYKNSVIYKNTKVIFLVHELLQHESIIQGIVNQKDFCNENNIYSKISEILKDEECGAFTFETFVLGDFDLKEDFCYLKKDFSSYGVLIGSNNFWKKINKAISIATSNFEMIRNFNSTFLFLKVIENFCDNGVDLTSIVNSKTENSLVIVSNK